MTTPERLGSQPSFEAQFADFINRVRAEGSSGNRTWLSDPDSGITMYIRDTDRHLGPPSRHVLYPPIPSSVSCLEIADVQNMHSIDPVRPEEFFVLLEKVQRMSPWRYMCLDQLGDDKIADACRDAGWTTDSWYGDDLLYVSLPDRPTPVEISTTVTLY